jgi:hypothetical protein
MAAHKYLRAEGWVFQHHRAVAELLYKAVFSLDSFKKCLANTRGVDFVASFALTCIRYFGYFITIEAIPNQGCYSLWTVGNWTGTYQVLPARALTNYKYNLAPIT